MGRLAGAPRLFYVATWLTIALWLLFYTFVYLHFSYSLLRFPFDFDQGEGYDVYSAWALVLGLPVYASPDAYPFYSSNYPPLYTLLLTPAVGLIGPRLSLGRVLSLAATAAVVALIVLAVRREARSWRPALAAGLLFLASPYVTHTTALARVNSLTLALALGGVVACNVAAERPRPARRWCLVAGGLLLAALYAKPTASDAAAAGLLYLSLRDRRRGPALAAALLGLGGALFVLIDWATAGGFSLNVVWANANPFSLEQVLAYYRNFVEIHLLLVSGALAVIVSGLRRGGWLGVPVYGWYFLAALATAVGTGKWGAGESYFLPALAAGCVLCGLALARLDALLTRARRPAAAGLLVLAFLLAACWQLLLLWHGPWAWPQQGAHDRGLQAGALGRAPTSADTAAGWKIVNDYIRKTQGDILAEESTFMLIDGHRVLGNPTQQRNLYDAGRHDPSALVGMLERGEIGLVILNAQQYPTPVLKAIGENYYAIEAVEMNGYRYLFLVPGRR